MGTQNKNITIEKSIKLLPTQFNPIIKLPGQKNLLQTPRGLIAYHYSSWLKNGLWVTSHNEDAIRNEIDYILFAIGSEGIILLSRVVLLSFYDKNFRGRFSDNRYPITVYKEAGHYYWKGRGGEKMDLTEYFYPNN